MTEEEFWSLIDLLGGAANQRTTPALTETLAQQGKGRVEEFADLLAENLQRLKSEPLSGISVRDVNDPSGAPPVPLFGDSLIHLHFAVVAAGSSHFQQIRKNPNQVTDFAWDFSESDSLSEAVSTAYEITSGQPWLGPLPGFCIDELEGSNAITATDFPWLSLAPHSENDIPTAYFETVGIVVEMIHTDPQWRTWWSRAEQRELSIEIEYTSQPERNNVTLRRGQAWASFRRNNSRFRGLNKNSLAALAVTDIEEILTLVSKSLGLPTPPQVPRPAHATPPTRKHEAARARLEELRQRHRKHS
ncbi:DUF4240 domain-containing protein [Streptomyces sp. ID05-47C]|uniref:DUF4240 domain-containing protein n=1 Tax=Streptomyces sp. ID05-47C TaxID=3028665 RepID=UPI0029BF6067|nr:DUF4240 domain-containing protein [Streptomyces sp. ID05-47C]MDX3569297.1 DUF4240 domain-containing protein [Streptomyces sp. ID05-47C]